jgi:hypothetical protein
MAAEKRGLPTYRSMLQADMRQAIEDANDFGHFLVLMENMGYEAKFGSRLSFRLRGEAQWIVPGRSDPLFTEDGIRLPFKEISKPSKPVNVPLWCTVRRMYRTENTRNTRAFLPYTSTTCTCSARSRSGSTRPA